MSRTDSVSNLILPLGFGAFQQVTNRASVSDLFENKQPVAGLYVLAFANGDYYAGRTKDIKQRFRTHRKTYCDIDYLAFKKLDPYSQGSEEKLLIHTLESKGIPLRNIVDVSNPDCPREIDDLIEPPAQEHWIETGASTDQFARQVNGVQRSRYSQKFKKLERESIFHDLIAFMKAYCQVGLIAPRMTEMSYWCASVSPTPSAYTGRKAGREYVRLNIANCEVLTVGKYWTYESQHPGPFFVFHTAQPERPAPREDFNEYLSKNHPGVLRVNHCYKPMGNNQTAFVSFGFDAATKLLDDPVITKAIRKGNMSLMRKRACLYSRYHCFELADHMIQDGS